MLGATDLVLLNIVNNMVIHLIVSYEKVSQDEKFNIFGIYQE